MGLPKKKTSYTRRNARRSHLALKQTGLVACGNCAEPALPHRVCPNCGYYKGKRALNFENE